MELPGCCGLAATGGVRQSLIGRDGQFCGRRTPANCKLGSREGGKKNREAPCRGSVQNLTAWAPGCKGWRTEIGGRMSQGGIAEAQ